MEYALADEPKRIGEILIKDHHSHLHGMNVVYLFQNKRDKKTGQAVMPKRKGKDLYGLAKLVTGLNAFLVSGDEATEGDEIEPFFVILITKMSWDRMSKEHKTALVDHELCHCDFDTESGRPSLRDHDVTEFHEIIKRYGPWTHDLEMFFKAAKQIKLPLDAAEPTVDNGNGASKAKVQKAGGNGADKKQQAAEKTEAGEGLRELKQEVASRRGGRAAATK